MVLDKAALRGRLDMHLTGHYMQLHITLVSLALGIAGLSAAGLISPPEGLHPPEPLFWILSSLSILATGVAYSGTVTGSFALPADLPKLWDLFPSLGVGLCEMLQFAVLSHQGTSFAHVDAIITAWFFAVAGFGLFAMCAVLRARRIFGLGSYTTDISPLIDDYRHRLALDARGAGGLAAIALAGGIVRAAGAQVPLWGTYVQAGVICAGLLHGLREQHVTSDLLRSGLA